MDSSEQINLPSVAGLLPIFIIAFLRKWRRFHFPINLLVINGFLRHLQLHYLHKWRRRQDSAGADQSNNALAEDRRGSKQG